MDSRAVSSYNKGNVLIETCGNNIAGNALTADRLGLVEEVGNICIELKVHVPVGLKLIIALKNSLLHPIAEPITDDSMDHSTEPTATDSRYITVMWPVNIHLLTVFGEVDDVLNDQVLILRDKYDFHIITFHSCTHILIMVIDLPFLLPSAISRSHQIEVWS